MITDAQKAQKEAASHRKISEKPQKNAAFLKWERIL
jgi:hypothetical protein